MLPVIIWLSQGKKKNETQTFSASDTKDARQNETLSAILSAAFRDRTYWCLLTGFSTCGFHMSIIETHLFSQYLSNGIPGSITSLALTVYGIATMLGAVITGFLGRRFRMKNVLASVYGIRVLIAVVHYGSLICAFAPLHHLSVF